MMAKRILLCGIIGIVAVSFIGATPSSLKATFFYPAVGKVELPDGDPVEGITVRFYTGNWETLVFRGSTCTNPDGYFFINLLTCGCTYTAIVGYSQTGPGSVRWVECDVFQTTDFGIIVIDGKLLPHH